MKTFAFALLLLIMMMPPDSCVQAATLTEDLHARISADLKSALHGDIELQEVRVVPVLDPSLLGELRITQLVQSGYAGRNRVNYLVSLQNPAGQTFSVLAEAVYEAFVEIMVTSRTIQKGEVIKPGDYDRLRQRSSRLPANAFVNADDVNGKTARMNLAEGLVLKRDHMLTPGYVKRGQKVKVEIEIGTIMVTAPGILRSGGTVGSTVKVFCDTSKREIQGMLIAPDLVRVKS
jgi:flagella basal body P-ring formation protein FlgA